MDLKEPECEGLNGAYVAEVNVQWRTLVNTAINLRLP
jgi:hypothetical protein